LKRGLDQIVQPAYVSLFGEDEPRKASAAAVTQTAGIDTK